MAFVNKVESVYSDKEEENKLFQHLETHFQMTGREPINWMVWIDYYRGGKPTLVAEIPLITVTHVRFSVWVNLGIFLTFQEITLTFLRITHYQPFFIHILCIFQKHIIETRNLLTNG